MNTWHLVHTMITNIPSHSDDLCLHLPLRARHLKFTGYSRRHWKSDLTGPPLHGYPDVRLWTLGWFKILMFWSWDLCTSHLICTTLMIISSYSEDFCHLQPLRASHRKFSGTVGDIENRTSPNPPFMGIQTSVCGHWSQRCMISGVLTWFWALKRPKTMKNDYYPENSHFLQFFSIFRY